MSTKKINIEQLPEADEVKNGDFFIIDDTVVTKRIDFKNIIFGLDNVTFASTISSQSTDIATLSSNLNSLSGEVYQEVDMLTALINSTVQASTGSFVNLLYPVGSIKYTTANINPATTLPSTSWIQISQGRFVAGVGADTDGNGTTFEVREGDTLNTAGEYSHELTVAEVPAHTHDTVVNVKNAGSGANNSYQNGPQAVGWRLDLPNTYTSTSVGGDAKHNNVPPLYGLYVWQRTS